MARDTVLNDAHMNIRLPKGDRDLLRLLAEIRNRSPSDEIREAIQAHLVAAADLLAAVPREGA